MGTYAKSFLDMQIEETEKNIKYNTSQKYHGTSYENLNSEEIAKEQAHLIKDPGLYRLARYNVIPDADYKKKLAADELVYKNKMENIFNVKNKNDFEGVNFYRVYRICERIIRANNLDYVNWRVAIRKTKDLNAMSTDTNYVEINTGLYDSLGENDDALAFVIGHEMAHMILGHTSRGAELATKSAYLNSKLSWAIRNNDTAMAVGYRKQLNDLFEESRQMEYMADSEGLSLIIKAGYSPEKARETLVLLESLQGKYISDIDNHPHGLYRIKNFENEYLVSDPNWVYVGRENLYNSEVLPCRKSSDRVSFVVLKSKNPSKRYYPENIEEKLTRMGYVAYLKGVLGLSKMYLTKLAKIKKTDYIPYLYISYANEVNYKVYKDKKWLKEADKAIKKAEKLAPTSPYVKEQMESVKKLKEQVKNNELVL